MTALLEREGVAFRLLTYEHDPAERSFGHEGAAKLGLPKEQVFKTLMIAPEGASGRTAYAVAVVPVAGRLDLKAAAVALGHRRAELADPTAAEHRTGFVRGGISPLAQRSPSPTVIDSSALDLTEMVVSAGRRGMSVALAPGDLVRLTGAVCAPISAPSPHGSSHGEPPAGQ